MNTSQAIQNLEPHTPSVPTHYLLIKICHNSLNSFVPLPRAFACNDQLKRKMVILPRYCLRIVSVCSEGEVIGLMRMSSIRIHVFTRRANGNGDRTSNSGTPTQWYIVTLPIISSSLPQHPILPYHLLTHPNQSPILQHWPNIQRPALNNFIQRIQLSLTQPIQPLVITPIATRKRHLPRWPIDKLEVSRAKKRRESFPWYFVVRYSEALGVLGRR